MKDKIRFAVVWMMVVMCCLGQALAEDAFEYRGVRFGMSAEELKQIESGNGVTGFTEEDGEVVAKYAEIDGVQVPVNIEYGFVDSALSSISIDAAGNRTLSDIVMNADAIWADGDVIMASFELPDEHYGKTYGCGWNVTPAEIHPQTPEDLRADLVWRIFLATGQDLFNDFEGYDWKQLGGEDRMFYYSQHEYVVAGENVLFTIRISASGDSVVSISFRVDSLARKKNDITNALRNLPDGYEKLLTAKRVGDVIISPAGYEMQVVNVQRTSYWEFCHQFSEDALTGKPEDYPPYYVATEIEFRNHSEHVIAGEDILNTIELSVYALPNPMYKENGWLNWKENMTPTEESKKWYDYELTEQYDDARIIKPDTAWADMDRMVFSEVAPGESIRFVSIVNTREHGYMLNYPMGYRCGGTTEDIYIWIDADYIDFSDGEISYDQTIADEIANSLCELRSVAGSYGDMVDYKDHVSRQQVETLICAYQQNKGLEETGVFDNALFLLIYNDKNKE